jgi:hypothetical protein
MMIVERTKQSNDRLSAWLGAEIEREWRHHCKETPMNKTLPSQNEAWGFYGTIRHHADPAEAWPIAMDAIAKATCCSQSGVRDFLDSRHGRHFADDVASGLFKGVALQQAINAAVDRWMTWTINRRTSRQTGIPRGLPYLVGFVTDCEIMAEANA